MLTLSGTPAETLRFDIDDSNNLRLWHDGEILLEDWNDKADLPWASEIVLQVEASKFDVDGVLEITALDGDKEVSSVSVRLRSPPLLLNHHLQPAELVVATQTSYGNIDNDSFLESFTAALGGDFESANGRTYGQDPWMQDEIEFASGTTPEGHTMFAVVDSIRDRGLDDYAEDRWSGEDFGTLVFGRGYANSLDSFGNLEVTPPIDGFPFGRIYYGAVASYAPHAQPLYNFLEDQVIQDPFQVDTSWLCVGHVDEFMTFLPDPTAPRGFRFVITDVDAAWDVLEAMDPDQALPRYAGRGNHDYDTVGELVDDNGLRALNDDLRLDYLEPILAQFVDELDLAPEEILRIPGLFETVSNCGGTVAALIPGMANLAVADLGDGPQVFMADPYLRVDLDDQGTDPMIDAVTDLFPTSLNLHFIDDWDVYHLALGEVHCGSNVLRTPSVADWWTNDLGGSQ